MAGKGFYGRVKWAVGATAAGALVIASGSAAAVSSDKFEYDATQVGYYSVSPHHLIPENDNADYQLDYFSQELRTTGFSCYYAGINLPQGALVASVQTWFTSDNQTNPLMVMYRQTLATAGIEEIAYQPLVDDSNTRVTVTSTIAGPQRLVKNGQYAYILAYCLDAGSKFNAARIRYTYTSAGD